MANDDDHGDRAPPKPMPGIFSGVSDQILKATGKLISAPYDQESWNVLIKDAQDKPIDESRSFFEQLVDRFPTSGRYWKIYIEQEMKHRNYDKVEKLFKRSLINVLNIDLFKCYLNYIREAKRDSPKFREKMGQAFDFALERVGIDLNSYSIYAEYVDFLKNVDTVGNFAENQKITSTRRIFQKGIIVPMLNIESFWKDYLTYEANINTMIKEKAIQDRSKDYMEARRVAKELETIMRNINRNAPAVPPSAASSQEENKQVEAWKRWIEWEKSNPLRSEDETFVIKRVVYAYEQCLLCLGHHSDIWFEYASYVEENSNRMSDKGDMNHHKALQEDVASIFERGIRGLLKENVLLHFCYADFEESRNRKEQAIKIYEKLLQIESTDFNTTLIYIQYMKFTRRTESITAARAIFARARKDERCTAQVYTSAALMEYYCSKDVNIACKIFELGLMKFPADTNYILSYVDFLSHLNEENNIRVLFERVLANDQLPLERSIEVWNKFLEFESQIGDLPSVHKVERRRQAVVERVHKKISAATCLVDKYKFLDLLPCSGNELKSIGYFKTQHANAQRTVGAKSDVPGTSGKNSAKELKKKNLFLPNLTQMMPFKPTKNDQSVGGYLEGPSTRGRYNVPSMIVSFSSQLPSSSSFNGPFVDVNRLLNAVLASSHCEEPWHLRSQRVPEPLVPQDAKGFLDLLVDNSVEKARVRKRNALHDDFFDSEENSNPANVDIFRARQLQRKKKKVL